MSGAVQIEGSNARDPGFSISRPIGERWAIRSLYVVMATAAILFALWLDAVLPKLLPD